MEFRINLFKKQRAEFKENIYSVYQPIVDIATWDVIAYEALARSEKETPVEMFRNAYAKGTVIPFDIHCLDAAIKVLPKLAKGQCLFLNIEPLTLEKAFSRGQAGEEFLRNMRVHSDKMVFELTEGVKKSDFEFIEKGVEFIRSLGYRFALDDIAEIGSKITQLASLKPEFFKIDLQLIHGIANNPLNQQIVREMVHLGRMNGSEMVAEGVENKEDLDLLRNMGIRYGQGFYLARPSRELIFSLETPHS
ncbi:MAG TPA: EAL domain-containing protein [Candidatus Omnitrophota bacterium]|nr:EAL domain-containing protein [Candidatus Omnitrophota bacterium]HPS36404.1 EAL domain-containing protein [Candidatus Omnitrophota bacterium]